MPPMIVMAGMMAVSTLVAARSAQQQGEAEQNQANYVAAQERVNAGQAQAASQRGAMEADKRTQVAESNLQADAAASGGTATDPTVTNDAAVIAGEGKYRSLTALYQGDSEAYADNNKASAAVFQGQQAREAGNSKAFSTLVSGASSLFSKYGSPYSGSSGLGQNITWNTPAQGPFQPQAASTPYG